MSKGAFNQWYSLAGVKRQSIIQVALSAPVTSMSTSSTSFVNTNLSVTITPYSSSSNILVLVNDACFGTTINTAYYEAQLAYCLYRDGYGVLFNVPHGFSTGESGAGYKQENACINIRYIDQARTTSPITYRTQIAADIDGSSPSAYAHLYSAFQSTPAATVPNTAFRMIAMEISA